MTTRGSWKRALNRSAALAVLLAFIGWSVVEIRQWLFRYKAQALLADINSLDVNRGTWSDARNLMSRWGRWGSWYGNCGPESCSYSIRICHLQWVYPGFVLQEGPHLGTRLLETAGLR